MAFRNLWSMPRDIKFLLNKTPDFVLVRKQPKADFTPIGGWFGSLFKIKTVLDHIECAPVIIISALPFFALATHLTRRLMTQNDLKFSRDRKMQCERHRYIIDGSPPPVHKYIVINQKYEWPEGLLKALRGDDCCEKKKGK